MERELRWGCSGQIRFINAPRGSGSCLGDAQLVHGGVVLESGNEGAGLFLLPLFAANPGVCQEVSAKRCPVVCHVGVEAVGL